MVIPMVKWMEKRRESRMVHPMVDSKGHPTEQKKALTRVHRRDSWKAW